MQGKEGYGGEAEADGDQARIKRVYNPATLQLGGPQLLEAMKDMIKGYKTCQQYLVRAKEIISWYEAFFSTSDTVFHMDTEEKLPRI